MIIGAGIIGLAIAREIKSRKPNAKIIILDKEKNAGLHASGRNSGVLHAGFYYHEDSLKAKFTRDGNQEMTEYCKLHKIKVNQSGKLVVTRNESELETLELLATRSKHNNSGAYIIDESKASNLEPNAKTYKHALYSPFTSSINPIDVVKCLVEELTNDGVVFQFGSGFKGKIDDNTVLTNDNKVFRANLIINTAGLYADVVAKQFGASLKYTILPFKGVYLKYTGNDQPLKMQVYPVPNIDNPFLGVHFTVTSDGYTKIGPTAIPAFWRENYGGFDNFEIDEFLNILGIEAKLLAKNSFNLNIS